MANCSDTKSKPRRSSIFEEADIADTEESVDITDAIIDFAAPLFGERHGDALPDDEMEQGIRLAIFAWNAGTRGVPKGTLEWTHGEAKRAVGAEKWATIKPLLDAMIAVRRTVYAHEPRLVVFYSLKHVPGKGRALQIYTAPLKKPLRHEN